MKTKVIGLNHKNNLTYAVTSVSNGLHSFLDISDKLLKVQYFPEQNSFIENP